MHHNDLVYLPTEIIYLILNYLTFEDKDKLLYLVFPKYYNLIFNEKEKFINNFSKQIIELFGGLDKMLYYPILQYNNRFSTIDYIDNISISDVCSNIMIGIDAYERPFIVLKYKCNNTDNLEVFFQRYTHDLNTWVDASKYHNYLASGSGYFLNRGLLDDSTKQNIRYVLDNNFTFII